MKFVCIQRCFDERIWEPGEKRESKTDLSVSSKKGAKICWRKVTSGLLDAEKAEKKTVRELWEMKEEELILYVKNRFKGTIFEQDMSKTNMIKEIALLEKAKEKEDKTGMV